MTEAKRTGALPGHFSPSQDVEAEPRQRPGRAKSRRARSSPRSASLLQLSKVIPA